MIMLTVFCQQSYIYSSFVVNDVEFLETGDATITYYDTLQEQNVPQFNIEEMRNLSTLQKNYYAVDKKTGMKEDMFNIDKLMAENLHINMEGNGPKILIFHTHGSETYADSNGINEGVIGAGEYLKQILEDKYGIECMHYTQRFDVVNGSIQRDGAYERAEPVISQIIAENPSIQLVIDLHRDGVNDNLRLVTNVNGEQCAKVMFFNGLCRKWTNGRLEDLTSLKNPYISTNLALSLKMQLKMNELYPNLTRKIYLNAYRYSLHMKDKSMLIELGAQTNTVKEVNNSVEKLAEVLYEIVG
jgi:hypothetical protein